MNAISRYMETKQRSSHRFCDRPGCGLSEALHGVSTAACSNFIKPGTWQAADCTKVVDMDNLRSDTIDRARLLEINRAQWAAIKRAEACVSLALTAGPTMFRVHCMAALAHLKGIADD